MVIFKTTTNNQLVTVMKNTLLSTALIIGSFAAVSLGANKPITGDINANYGTHYNYHNMVPTSQLADSGSTTIGVDLQYEIPSVFNVVANFSHTSIDSNWVQDGHHLLGAMEDQTTLFFGIEGEGIKGLTTSFGYQLTDGGLPGFFAGSNGTAKKIKNGIMEYSDNTMDHQIRFDALYEVENSGLFFTGSVAYSVHGTQGWQMDVGAGYLWTVTEQMDIVASANVSFSQDYMRYWDGKETRKYNGTDGYSVTVAAPIKASESVVITPYISAVFSGHNPKGFSQDLTRDNGRLFKEFAVVAGVGATWSF